MSDIFKLGIFPIGKSSIGLLVSIGMSKGLVLVATEIENALFILFLKVSVLAVVGIGL